MWRSAGAGAYVVLAPAQICAPGTPNRALEAFRTIHIVIGMAIVVLAVLVVSTSRPRLPRRIYAAVVALAVVAVVLGGCGKPAAAAPETTSNPTSHVLSSDLAVTVVIVLALAVMVVASVIGAAFRFYARMVNEPFSTVWSLLKIGFIAGLIAAIVAVTAT
jgi:hypothetical protein